MNLRGGTRGLLHCQQQARTSQPTGICYGKGRVYKQTYQDTCPNEVPEVERSIGKDVNTEVD